MKSLTLVVFVLAAILAVTYAEDDETPDRYSTKYDDVNVDEILANKKLRKQYENCYLDKGPCVTPDAVYFKSKFLCDQYVRDFLSVRSSFLYLKVQLLIIPITFL